MEMMEKFLHWATENQWQLELKKEKYLEMPPEITQRYQTIPEDFTEFLASVKFLSNKNKTAWFLFEEDYSSRQPSYAARWNEPEQISIESAQGDAALVNEIRAWWSKRFPIAIVSGEKYEYYAIDLDKSGAIVHGKHPDYESPSIVAHSLEDFFKKIMLGEIDF